MESSTLAYQLLQVASKMHEDYIKTHDNYIKGHIDYLQMVKELGLKILNTNGNTVDKEVLQKVIQEVEGDIKIAKETRSQTGDEEGEGSTEIAEEIPNTMARPVVTAIEVIPPSMPVLDVTPQNKNEGKKSKTSRDLFGEDSDAEASKAKKRKPAVTEEEKRRRTALRMQRYRENKKKKETEYEPQFKNGETGKNAKYVPSPIKTSEDKDKKEICRTCSYQEGFTGTKASSCTVCKGFIHDCCGGILKTCRPCEERKKPFSYM